MIFSKACEYGVRAAIYVAQRSLQNERCSMKDISKEIDSPEAFTAKILQTLVRADIISSVKGATGGFEIDIRHMKKVKFSDIITAVDGGVKDKICVLGLEKCSESQPCPVHHKFKHIKKDILAMINNTTLYEMSNSVEAGLSCLKIRQ